MLGSGSRDYGAHAAVRSGSALFLIRIPRVDSQNLHELIRISPVSNPDPETWFNGKIEEPIRIDSGSDPDPEACFSEKAYLVTTVRITHVLIRIADPKILENAVFHPYLFPKVINRYLGLSLRRGFDVASWIRCGEGVSWIRNVCSWIRVGSWIRAAFVDSDVSRPATRAREQIRHLYENCRTDEAPTCKKTLNYDKYQS